MHFNLYQYYWLFLLVSLQWLWNRNFASAADTADSTEDAGGTDHKLYLAILHSYWVFCEFSSSD